MSRFSPYNDFACVLRLLKAQAVNSSTLLNYVHMEELSEQNNASQFGQIHLIFKQETLTVLFWNGFDSFKQYPTYKSQGSRHCKLQHIWVVSCTKT